MRSERGQPSRRDAGFSIAELLAVLLVLSIAALAVLPSARRSASHSSVRLTASDISAVLNAARLSAMTTGQSKAVILDGENGAYGQESRELRTVPRGIRMTAVASLDSSNNERSIIRIGFRSNGASRTIRINLTDGMQWASIEVEGITGRIRIREPGRN